MKTPLSLLFFSLAISTTAYSTEMVIDSMDVDIEAAISKTLFTKVDTDNDGKISFDEVFEYRIKEEKARDQAHTDDLFSRCDKNKDGKIGEDELVKVSFNEFDPAMNRGSGGCTAPTAILDMMDADGDGFITKKEITNLAHNRPKPPRKFREKMEKREAKQRSKFQKEQFARCDTDKDEYLNLREAASMKCHMYTEMFDARDKDGDSLITLNEMLADVKPQAFDDGGPEHSPIDPKMPFDVQMDIRIANCDENDNGKLELVETNKKDCAMDLADFNSADYNSDGTIDYNETKRLRMKTQFDELDENNDGWLDKKEFKGSRIRYL